MTTINPTIERARPRPGFHNHCLNRAPHVAAQRWDSYPANSKSSAMKAVLINTTFQLGHHGCTLVDRQLDLLTAEAGLDVCVKLPLHADWQKLAPADFDLVLVNGEGALHHDSKAARRLAEVPLWARERGRPAFLINSVYEANGPEIAAGVARFDAVFARDELSRGALTEAGIAATVVPDLALTWEPTAT